MPDSRSYLDKARRRQRRAGRSSGEVRRAPPATASAVHAAAYQPHVPAAKLPYGGARKARRLSDAPRRGRTPSPNLQPAPDAAEDVSLPEEFNRVQRAQHAYRARRPRPRLRRPWLYVAIGLPVLILLVAVAILGPVLYEGTRAYQDVFVEPPPHEQPPVVAVINDAGTPVLATAPAAAEEEIPEWDGQDRVTILLLGIDRREDAATRSDTMILVNVDPVTGTAGMLSIPRDLKVMIPGYGVEKINAAYAYGDRDEVPGGGPGLTIRTIEANFGIRINYFAQVDFEGFVKIVDTVGGITVDVPYPIKDDAYPASGTNYTRVYFSTGWQHMDGERALQYARTRHYDGDGRRTVRQQQVLLALRQQAVSLDLLPKARDLISEVGDSVRTDLSLQQVLQLAQLAAEFTADDITQYSLFGGLTEQELPGEPYYLVPDWEICGEILSKFMGTEVVPPASVLADPNFKTPIRVANGTSNPGLAQRVADVLTANGFSRVEVVDGETLAQEATRIVDGTGDLATSMHLAGVIGVGVETINLPGSSADASATSRDDATPVEEAIVVVLGDDAPDPAFFSAIPVEEEINPAVEQPSGPMVGDGASREAVDDGSIGADDVIVPVDETRR